MQYIKYHITQVSWHLILFVPLRYNLVYKMLKKGLNYGLHSNIKCFMLRIAILFVASYQKLVYKTLIWLNYEKHAIY